MKAGGIDYNFDTQLVLDPIDGKMIGLKVNIDGDHRDMANKLMGSLGITEEEEKTEFRRNQGFIDFNEDPTKYQAACKFLEENISSDVAKVAEKGFNVKEGMKQLLEGGDMVVSQGYAVPRGFIAAE